LGGWLGQVSNKLGRGWHQGSVGVGIRAVLGLALGSAGIRWGFSGGVSGGCSAVELVAGISRVLAG